MADEHERGSQDELAMVRMEHSVLHALSLIEKSAREARSVMVRVGASKSEEPTSMAREG